MLIREDGCSVYVALTNAITDIIDSAPTYISRNSQAHDFQDMCKVLGYTVGEAMRGVPKGLDSVLRDYEWVNADMLEMIRVVFPVLLKLHEAGFAYVGHGFFSVVVRHEDAPGVVFKIGCRKDDAYAAYALWARETKNKHAPEFKHIQRCKHGIVFCIKEYATLRTAFEPDMWGAFRPLELVYRAKTNDPNTIYRNSLVQYMRSILRFFKGAARIDVHDENLMYDLETRRIIITDPVSFTNSKEDYSC